MNPIIFQLVHILITYSDQKTSKTTHKNYHTKVLMQIIYRQTKQNIKCYLLFVLNSIK